LLWSVAVLDAVVVVVARAHATDVPDVVTGCSYHVFVLLSMCFHFLYVYTYIYIYIYIFIYTCI
jgi:hypothetical protein